MVDIQEAWVAAGLRNVVADAKRRRSTTWTVPSSATAAAIIAGAMPLIEAQLREEIAVMVEGLGVPGVERRACEEAAAAVRKGLP